MRREIRRQGSGPGLAGPSGAYVPHLSMVSDQPGQGLGVCVLFSHPGSGGRAPSFPTALFSPGQAGEGASRRLSADPSSCPVIIPAKQVARAGLSHQVAKDSEAWRGWPPVGIPLLSTYAVVLQGSQIALPSSGLGRVGKCVRGEAGFGSVGTGAHLVPATLNQRLLCPVVSGKVVGGHGTTKAE